MKSYPIIWGLFHKTMKKGSPLIYLRLMETKAPFFFFVAHMAQSPLNFQRVVKKPPRCQSFTIASNAGRRRRLPAHEDDDLNWSTSNFFNEINIIETSIFTRINEQDPRFATHVSFFSPGLKKIHLEYS